MKHVNFFYFSSKKDECCIVCFPNYWRLLCGNYSAVMRYDASLPITEYVRKSEIMFFEISVFKIWFG